MSEIKNLIDRTSVSYKILSDITEESIKNRTYLQKIKYHFCQLFCDNFKTEIEDSKKNILLIHKNNVITLIEEGKSEVSIAEYFCVPLFFFKNKLKKFKFFQWYNDYISENLKSILEANEDFFIDNVINISNSNILSYEKKSANDNINIVSVYPILNGINSILDIVYLNNSSFVPNDIFKNHVKPKLSNFDMLYYDKVLEYITNAVDNYKNTVINTKKNPLDIMKYHSVLVRHMSTMLTDTGVSLSYLGDTNDLEVKKLIIDTNIKVASQFANIIGASKISADLVNEKAKRLENFPVLLDSFTKNSFFSEQVSFINNASKSIIMLCSRRAGKSYAIAGKLFLRCLQNPDFTCIYITKTIANGIKILGGYLEGFCKSLDINFKFVNNKNLFEININEKQKSYIYFAGLDNSLSVDKLRGYSIDLACIDEAQSVPVLNLKKCLDIILPATMQSKLGQLVLCGTPSLFVSNFFNLSFIATYTEKNDNDLTEIYLSKYYNYISPNEASNGRFIKCDTAYYWNINSNPYISNSLDIVRDACKLLNIPFEDYKTNPLIQREYYGIICEDNTNLVFNIHNDCLVENFNNYQYDTVIISIDLGVVDNTAVSFLAFNSNDLFSIDSKKLVSYEAKQNIKLLFLGEKIFTEIIFADFIPDVRKWHSYYTNIGKFVHIVYDCASAGSQFGLELRTAYPNFSISSAIKYDKIIKLKSLSEKIDRREFFIRQALCSQFIMDSNKFVWVIDDNSNITTNSDERIDGFHSDVIDSVLYGYNKFVELINSV